MNYYHRLIYQNDVCAEMCVCSDLRLAILSKKLIDILDFVPGSDDNQAFESDPHFLTKNQFYRLISELSADLSIG